MKTTLFLPECKKLLLVITTTISLTKNIFETHSVKYARIQVFREPYFSVYTGKYASVKTVFTHLLRTEC